MEKRSTAEDTEDTEDYSRTRSGFDLRVVRVLGGGEF